MRKTLAVAVVSLCAACGGCAKHDPRVQAERERFVLSAEPTGAQGVLDVREAIQGEQSVLLLGQIGGVSEPWTEGRAAFVVADPSVLMEVEGHSHDGECHDGCPFCAKKLQDIEKESLAFVQFLTPDGAPLPIDARKLFELQPRQTVVVRGKARVDESGYLVVSADGLYVRR